MHHALLLVILCSLWINTDNIHPEQHKIEQPAAQPFILPHSYNENLNVKTGYGPKTGKWFLSDKGGQIGFSISGGYKKAGSDVSVKLAAPIHDRNIRFRLSKLDKSFKPISILDEKIDSMVSATSPDYSNRLPQDQNALYLLSAEVLGITNEVEDTLLSVVYAPILEIKSAMSLDKKQYSKLDTVRLNISNYGPSVLMFGKPYKIQKYNQSEWENAPIQRAFTLEGIGLEPGKTYEQKVTINDLEPGKYRILKEVSIMDIHDIKETLTAEFEVISPEHSRE
ncbi:immunoglobulin-like domain-containing protein [Paenibacillus radicis (ex Xue et al. 2023)]|uniref:Bacterial Ig-like domain-containing protein n=1 Tax=Paenibacillus radicis (ex Xue et al. 2023) TaxID=2972489 RepID=A0ABT1YAJ5_9BACL|nr:immunoglobulin-like domain-containing protein [Paenibacillus radicis (ex Xue et al. 2023)]MCR8630219.1 hypothetical protein [Paenibacillus radicis (ex Xue et al. 2023)]